MTRFVKWIASHIEMSLVVLVVAGMFLGATMLEKLGRPTEEKEKS